MNDINVHFGTNQKLKAECSMQICWEWKNAHIGLICKQNHLGCVSLIIISFFVFLYQTKPVNFKKFRLLESSSYSLLLWLFIKLDLVIYLNKLCWWLRGRVTLYYYSFVACLKVVASLPFVCYLLQCTLITLALWLIRYDYQCIIPSCRIIHTRSCCLYQLRSASYSANHCNYTMYRRLCS